MKKTIFLTISFFLPLASVLAHNGVEDGDGPLTVPPTGTEKLHVAVGLVLVVLVVALVIWWTRRKKV